MATYLLHLAVMVALYILLAQSLNLMMGYTGLLSLCQGAFFGIGAYIAAGLSLNGVQDLLVSVLVCAVGGWLGAWAFSLPLIRIGGGYFVIFTLGVQALVISALRNFVGLTNGPLGIGGIQRGTLAGVEIPSDGPLLIFAVILAALVHWLLRRILRSPVGSTLKAIREDEAFAESLGYDSVAFKRHIFSLGAAIAACAGGVYARYTTFIEPGSFELSESIVILTMVILGGLGSLRGAAAGALLLVILPELLRVIGVSSSAFASLRQVVYGCIILLCLLAWPRGLMGEIGVGELQPRRLR